MYPSLLLSAALVAPAAPLPPDANTGPIGPAPRVLALKADAAGTVRVTGTTPIRVTVNNAFFVVENNKQVMKQVEQDVLTTQYFNKTLADYNAKFTTAGGTPLTLAEATARVKAGATVLASSDGKPVAKAWLRAAAPDTVVMVADGFAHVQLTHGTDPMPTTPDPRLTLLGTDEQGRVMAPCTSAPVAVNTGAYYANNMIMQQRVAFGGKRIRNFDSVVYPGAQPEGAKVVFKPLADVKFDAYDRGGKRIPRGEALKRLAAGGLVLVTGDNRMPDEAYLKGLRDDMMILSAAELVLPVAPIDQTKKKGKPAGGANPPAVPPLPPVQVAPALPVKPAIIINGGAVRRNAVLPAPKVEAKPAEKK